MSSSTDHTALHLRARDELASLALGEAVEPAVDDHVRGCVACQTSLAQLREVVAGARDGRETGIDERPAPDMWSRIAIKAGLDADALPVTAPAPGLRAPRRRRGTVLLAAVVAVVAVGAGAVGWAVGHSSRPDAPRRAAVAALSAQAGTDARASGRATMHPQGRGYAMSVQTTNLPAPPGYYEVWLFDPIAQRMVAIGTLGAGGRGSFTLPTGLDVSRYRVVDVSAQRFDGDPRHQRSVLQGPLDR